ncbi:MAG: peptide chain release factor 2, partial [Candidatus Eisenbacteria bacterium]|nr:peptide chain release factor 2 [Candidatus Eisenbacteria bacterium]
SDVYKRQVLKQLRVLKGFLARHDEVRRAWEDLGVLLSLSEEEGDEAAREAGAAEKKLRRELESFELATLLNEEHDVNNAILAIHPGAGGTESQDWAEMLLRMYLRWVEANGFKANILDYQPGDEAGIKDATLEVEGEYAYGYLKAESGIHRLVRISPFDAAKRRHTSFASVFVLPQVAEVTDVEMKDEDLRIDTFRASGAGGQHVNKTDSAVRITHLPTGIVVQSQAERSQHRNREFAMKILVARLWAWTREQEAKKLGHLEDSKTEIAWGHQIRSYVFQPYTMVKDHRTAHETGDVQRVMDGDLNGFIDAYLRQRKGGALRG